MSKLLFFYTAWGVAVPRLAAGTLPKVLACFKPASCTAVTCERFSSGIQRALHGRVMFFVGKSLLGQPTARGHQRWLVLQMLGIPVTPNGGRGVRHQSQLVNLYQALHDI